MEKLLLKVSHLSNQPAEHWGRSVQARKAAAKAQKAGSGSAA
jgi:hypothetical protein